MKEITIKILNDLDFKIGKFVTVVNQSRGDMSYRGDILEVVSVDIPFIILFRHDRYEHNSYEIKLDLREWELKELSDHYVKRQMKIIEDYRKETT